jgi:TolB-like protein
MKSSLFLVLLLPAAAFSDPAYPTGNTSVVVFNFQVDAAASKRFGVANAGQSVASLLAHDLSLLAPIRVIDHGAVQKGQGQWKINLGDPVTAEDARRIGQLLGATSFVTGRVFESGSEIILAAKVVSAGTGQALGTMVKGDHSTPIADLISRLGAQVGRIALVQNGAGPAEWTPATIVGTRRRATSTGSSIAHDQVACVLAIDGMAIPDEVDKWGEKQLLLPGLHEVFVRYYDGTSMPGHDFTFDAKPGASYEVVSESGPSSAVAVGSLPLESLHNAGGGSPRIWIRDQETQQAVTDVAVPSMESRRPELPVVFVPQGFEPSINDNPDYVRPQAARSK